MEKTVNELITQYGHMVSRLAKRLVLTTEEQRSIIYVLLNNILRNDFFKKATTGEREPLDFEQVITYLKQYQLDDETIRTIIVNSPQLLLFCNRLDDIYLIYKNEDYKSYALVDGNDYRCYEKNGNGYHQVLSTNMVLAGEFPNLIEKQVLTDDPHHVETILSSTERTDISDYFKIEENDTVKDIFEKLRTGYSKKNYYVKALPETEKRK